MRRKVAPINKPIICVNRGHKFAARPFALLNRRRILGRAVVASRRRFLRGCRRLVVVLRLCGVVGLCAIVRFGAVGQLGGVAARTWPVAKTRLLAIPTKQKARRAFSRSISHICACSLVNIGPPLQMWSFSCLQRSPSKSLHSVGVLWQ